MRASTATGQCFGPFSMPVQSDDDEEEDEEDEDEDEEDESESR